MELWNELPGASALLDDQMNILKKNRRWDSLVKERELSDLDFLPDGQIYSSQSRSKIFREWLQKGLGEFRKVVFSSSDRYTESLLAGSSRYGDHILVSLIPFSSGNNYWYVEDSGGVAKPDHYQHLVGKSDPMRELFQLIHVAAGSISNVLITGESGTGKELISRAVHNLSERKDKPFIAVNCSALSEQLLESELFGHVKGAFTGADKDKVGRFEAAEQGTIFLDEIGDISPLIQVKLLRVLQEKVIERVGSHVPVKVDMRIIGATNRNLRQMVQEGTFREDLFYRLNVFSIKSIPLREMQSDIPLLCDSFISHFRKTMQKDISGLSPDVLRLFMEYCWPGNVRELRNTIEHAFVVSQGPRIDIFDLPQELRVSEFRKGVCKGKLAGYTDEETPRKATRHRRNISDEDLMEVLERNGGNKAAAARELGISRVSLYNKLKSLSLTAQ